MMSGSGSSWLPLTNDSRVAVALVVGASLIAAFRLRSQAQQRSPPSPQNTGERLDPEQSDPNEQTADKMQSCAHPLPAVVSVVDGAEHPKAPMASPYPGEKVVLTKMLEVACSIETCDAKKTDIERVDCKGKMPECGVAGWLKEIAVDVTSQPAVACP